MRDLKLDDLAVYERRVRAIGAELQELIEEVMVAESWFFRDKRPFEWLREYFAEVAECTGKPPFADSQRAVCTGRRALFHCHRTLRNWGFRLAGTDIDAVDISARRLAIARRGVYSHNAFRGTGHRVTVPVLSTASRRLRVDPALRATVRFIHGSILDPRLLEGSSLYDVVFCRNLLIYLVPSARAALAGVYRPVLAPDGVLFIGHADRLDSAGAERRFAAAGEPGCFAYRRIPCGDQLFPRFHMRLNQTPILSLLALLPSAAVELVHSAAASGSIEPATPR